MKRNLLLIVVIFFPFVCHAGIKAAISTDTTTTIQKTDTTRDGSSFDKAIMINETSEQYGDPAEYTWIRKNYPGATNNSQALFTIVKSLTIYYTLLLPMAKRLVFILI